MALVSVQEAAHASVRSLPDFARIMKSNPFWGVAEQEQTASSVSDDGNGAGNIEVEMTYELIDQHWTVLLEQV